MIRKHAWYFAAVALAGLVLRLFLVFRAPGVVDDSRLYADIATNWLQHGIYGITNSGTIMPTLSRLPGYPAFLAAIFGLFGRDNFRAALLLQTLFDMATCFLAANIARRLFSVRAAKTAFLLAALCPFLANYAAAALTETLEIFFTALAMELAFRGLGIGEISKTPRVVWLACGCVVGGAILLRPDGGILLASIGGYLFWQLAKSAARSRGGQRTTNGRSVNVVPVGAPRRQRFIPTTLLIAGVLLTAGALFPLVPWTIRNLHTLHRFQPLAPRYANDADEALMPGFNRWVKTWTADYISVQEIYWPVPGSDIDFSRLPNRAFDSSEQRNQTAALFSEYNANHDMTAELDARFGDLAEDRIRGAPVRYYVWLPALRIADMWLRPRTELFPSDPRWWEFNDDHRWLALSLAFGAINLAYVLTGVVGLWRSREFFGIGLFVSFLLLRSLFLGTLENPEPRYTLECYPVIIILASSLFSPR